IHGFGARCGTGVNGLVRGAVILKTDAVILKECRALHNMPRWPRRNYNLAAPPAIQPRFWRLVARHLPSRRRDLRIGRLEDRSPSHYPNTLWKLRRRRNSRI